MNVNVREEILGILGQLGDLTPDLRFGQLIANLAYLAVGPSQEAIWDVEDAELLDAMRQHLDVLSSRQPAAV